jgi:malate dehydrogenase (oxaloacetate-decarboxylating)
MGSVAPFWLLFGRSKSAMDLREITFKSNKSHVFSINSKMSVWRDFSIMNLREKSLKLHGEWKGKIEVISKVSVKTKEDLALAYTPGVAEPCLVIQKDVTLSYEYTRRWNMVAVVTDGTAVLGLGDIGPEAGMPVMEGKCVLFKVFGDVDAFPLCLRSKDVDEIVNTVKLLAGSFGGVNLEDISAPRCFEIERRLKQECDIPIFHDDQHGTAVVTLAAMLNALKIVKKDFEDLEVVVNGSGAAGIAVTKLLMSMGLKKVILCDTKGAIYEGRDGLNAEKTLMARISNLQKKQGSLQEVIVGADVLIGVSAPNMVTPEMVRTMAPDPIIFAMANPVPEIMPEEAKAAGARVVGTGRSDFANQINNVLAFPGIFRGALDVRASDINDAMKIAAAQAIAALIKEEELSPDYVIPAPFDVRVGQVVAEAVAQAARESGVARR